MPPLPADFIHARACKLKCEKILTRPTKDYKIDSIDNHVFLISCKNNKKAFRQWPNMEKVMRTAHCSTNGSGLCSQNFTDIFPKK